MPQEFFKSNRQRFLNAIQDGVAILPAAPEARYSNDVEYKYRQNSDLHYLTGFKEPDSVLILAPNHTHPYTLFVRPRHQEREIWTGFRSGVEGALHTYGADAAYPISELEEKLPEYLENTHTLYYEIGFSENFDRLVLNALKAVKSKVRTGVHAPQTLTTPGTYLHEMRLLKQEHEIALMQKAADITVAAHKAAMQSVQPGMYEYEVEALIDYHFKKQGAAGPGYPSIVGSGVNATILHYIENNAPMQNGDLLLIDAGAEYQYYNADVTRTFPINGKFTEIQKRLYQVVLEAQKKAVLTVHPGVSFMKIHETARDTLIDGLKDLGLLNGSHEEIIENKSHEKFYMHKTSHWLGMDVHDMGEYKMNQEWRPLQPGMVLTVEPGLYFGPHLVEEVPQEYLNIGIRIEDDVLVTVDGHRVLTSGVPKEIGDIEALMNV